MTERRSNRAKSNINYSKYVCDDDDDFADPTPPMKKLKKNKENCNQSVQLKEKLQTNDKKSKSRKPPPEDRLLEIQIKEALAASLKETSHDKNDSVVEDDKDAQTVVKEAEDCFFVNDKPISTSTQKDPDKNSKVKTDDEIEIISSTTVSHSPPRKRQKTSRFNCLDSDSDDDNDSTFAAESDDSDDDEFDPDGDDDDFNSHKKFQDKSKKRTNQVKTKQVNKAPVPNSSTNTPKSTKSFSKLTPKSTTIPSICKTPTINTSGSSATASSVTSKSAALSRTPVSQPRKIPSWTPPGPAGKSSESANMKSPGGIRIGLSRQQRVKTLHPSLTVQH